MAMTLRLDEQEPEALRHRAAREARSMQEVAHQAIRDYIDALLHSTVRNHALVDGNKRLGLGP